LVTGFQTCALPIWQLEPATATVKSMAAEYTAMNFSAAGLSKDQLRFKLGRTKAIRKLLA
jgi:hypothetical protein